MSLNFLAVCPHHLIDRLVFLYSGDPIPPEVHIFDEQFGTINVIVVLEWIGSGNVVSYNISFTPENPPETLFHGNTQLELVLLYNTLYNLMVTSTLCGENNATSTTELHYGTLMC